MRNTTTIRTIVAILLLQVKGFTQSFDHLRVSTPEKEGIASAAISNFLNAVDSNKIELHSFVLVRHGKVVTNASWQPYSSKNKHMLYSITKSFVSTAIGFAVDDKRLSVDDKVRSFFPEWGRDTSQYWAELTVKHLLMMSVGQHASGAYSDPIALVIEKNDDWVKLFFDVPILYKPGSRFLYNTLASHVLSAIVEKTTKMKTADYLTLKLFKPLGIKDFDWEVSPTGVNTGGWGLRLTPEDMAKIGQFFLQNGKWQGKQILSEAWIKEATSFKIAYKPTKDTARDAANDWNQGYGYQWWLYQKGIYAAQGSEGQSIIVMPEQDAVIAVTGNVGGKQNVMHLIRTILLPAMQTTPLLDNANALNMLQHKQDTLQHLPSEGISGKPFQKSFRLNTNGKKLDSIAFNCTAADCVLQLKTTSKTFTLHFGNQKWQAGETEKKGPYRMHSPTTFDGLPPFKVVGSFHWADDNTLKLTLRYLESAHFETFICHFDNNTLKMDIVSSMNVTNKYTSMP